MIIMFRDDYRKEFGKQDAYTELVDAQRKLEADQHWYTDIKALATTVVTPENSEELADRYSLPLDAVQDTAKNSGLLLTFDGLSHLVRTGAMPSLLNTAGISGLGVSRATKMNLAVGLSAFLAASKENRQILYRCGKVSAVLSKQYQYMPIQDMLEICEGLEANFGEGEFVGGSVTHDLTVASWQFPEATGAVTKAYNAVLTAHNHAPNQELTPVVEFRASDTSNEAAHLLTYLRVGNGHLLIPIGTGISVSHVRPKETGPSGIRLSCVEKFEMDTSGLFAKINEELPRMVERMVTCKINWPANAVIGLCKYAGIPQKWGGLVEEQVASMFPDGSPCSMLDIYESMVEVIPYAIADGITPQAKRILDMNEGLTKVANAPTNVWKRYDVPGTVTWGVKANK